MNFEFVNFNKSSKELMVGLINKTCRKEFTPAQLIFSTPVPITGNKNTELGLTSVGVGFFAGTTVQYNRLDLTTMFQGVAINLANGVYATTADIIEDINQTYSLMMGSDDIILENVVWDADNKYVLKAAPGSLIWTGQVDVVMDVPAVEPPPAKPTMTSLYPPTSTIDFTALNWNVTHRQWIMEIAQWEETTALGGSVAHGMGDDHGSLTPNVGYVGQLGDQITINKVFWPHWGEGSYGQIYMSTTATDPTDYPREIIVDGITAVFQQWLPDENYIIYHADREVLSADVLSYVLLEFGDEFITSADLNNN